MNVHSINLSGMPERITVIIADEKFSITQTIYSGPASFQSEGPSFNDFRAYAKKVAAQPDDVAIVREGEKQYVLTGSALEVLTKI